MKIPKLPNHSHYWVKDGRLFETYEDILGEQSSYEIMPVQGEPDTERCTPDQMEDLFHRFL